MDTKVMTQEPKQRITYIDTVKGFSIIFIVIQHAITNNPDIWQVNQIYLLRFITQMAMPTFFFVNGFLYSNKYSERPVWGILRKVKAYYVPFVCYNFFFLICNNLFVKLHLQNDVYGDGLYTAKDFLSHTISILTGHREHMGGAMWFLRSILVISVIYILVDFWARKIQKGKFRYILLGVIVFIIVGAASMGFIPESLSNFRLEGIFFFYLGFLAKEFNWNERLQKNSWRWFGLSTAICLIGAFAFSVGITRKTLIDEGIYLLMGCVGIIFLFLCAQIKFVQKWSFLSKIGSCSLEIMCLHFLAFKVVSLIIIGIQGLSIERLPEYPVIMYVGGAWWLMYVVVGVVLPCIYASILTKCEHKIKLLVK